MPSTTTPTRKPRSLRHAPDPGDTLYARVKPYNPEAGFKVQRIFVKCLNTVMEGGDGVKVPIEWKPITEKIGRVLSTYKQNDQQPFSPPVFDIVDEATMLAMEEAEERARRAGLLGKHARQPQPAGRDTRYLEARNEETGHNVEQAVEEALKKAERYNPEIFNRPVVSAAPTIIPGAESFLAGRMEALEGVDTSGEPLEDFADTPRSATSPSARAHTVAGERRQTGDDDPADYPPADYPPAPVSTAEPTELATGSAAGRPSANRLSRAERQAQRAQAKPAGKRGGRARR